MPDDVSVAGFDGADLPWLGAVRLTTVVQPTDAKGRAAARAAMALVDGERPDGVLLPVVAAHRDDERTAAGGLRRSVTRSRTPEPGTPSEDRRNCIMAPKCGRGTPVGNRLVRWASRSKPPRGPAKRRHDDDR